MQVQIQGGGGGCYSRPTVGMFVLFLPLATRGDPRDAHMLQEMLRLAKHRLFQPDNGAQSYTSVVVHQGLPNRDEDAGGAFGGGALIRGPQSAGIVASPSLGTAFTIGTVAAVTIVPGGDLIRGCA